MDERQVLRVDLQKEKVTVEPLPLELRRKYVGGEGINSWLLWEHFLKVDPHIDPLSPDNVLIAGIGPLAATGFGAGSKMKWTFKSPAYNLFGDSSCGGNFGSHLRWAGYDHIVITGRARQPTYLWIKDGEVELRDASHLWGRDVEEADELIKEGLGHGGVETACIGRGAENLVRYAGIQVSRHRAAGRTGAGCVMASKNLKAVAVLGTKGIAIHDPQISFGAMNAYQTAIEKHRRMVDGWRNYGTITGASYYQHIGVHAWRNNQGSVLPQESYEKLHQRWYVKHIARSTLSCSPGCLIGCSGSYRIKGNETPFASQVAGESGIRPEFGGVASFGIMCDIPDLVAIAHLWKLCCQYGIDVIEIGACAGLLMELWQRGIISSGDTTDWFGEPVSLDWGNVQAVEKIIHSVALQQNKIGKMLRSGVYRAAQQLEEIKGVPVLKYAIYGKGGSAFIEEMRNTPSWATNMAVASRGCDHLKGVGTLDKVNRADISMLYFGTPDGAKPQDITLKGAGSALAENRSAVINCLGICVFILAADPILYTLEMFAGALRAATGLQLSPEELAAAGERTVNLEKAFNSRLGYRREDDLLCERWMHEPITQGPGQGWKCADYLDKTKDEYYEYHGWDKETSLQTRERLQKLELEDVAEVLAAENALI